MRNFQNGTRIPKNPQNGTRIPRIQFPKRHKNPTAQESQESHKTAQESQESLKNPFKYHKAFKYFLGKIYQSVRYLELPKEYWRVAKTSNRLERFFEELKRRIRVFRRFPNTQSCQRWLYALITEIKPNSISITNSESQQSS